MTLILQGGREIRLSSAQLAVKGITYAASIIGSSISGSLYKVGEKYGLNNALEQTQERFDRGQGVKAFTVEMSQGTQLTQGLLLEGRKALKEMFSGFNVGTQQAAATPATAAPAAAPVAENNPLETVEDIDDEPAPAETAPAENAALPF